MLSSTSNSPTQAEIGQELFHLQQERKVCKALRVQQALKVTKELQALKVSQVHKAHKVFLERKAQLEQQVRKVIKDKPDQQERKAL
jgi:hypothetical protein